MAEDRLIQFDAPKPNPADIAREKEMPGAAPEGKKLEVKDAKEAKNVAGAAVSDATKNMETIKATVEPLSRITKTVDTAKIDAAPAVQSATTKVKGALKAVGTFRPSQQVGQVVDRGTKPSAAQKPDTIAGTPEAKRSVAAKSQEGKPGEVPQQRAEVLKVAEANVQEYGTLLKGLYKGMLAQPFDPANVVWDQLPNSTGKIQDAITASYNSLSKLADANVRTLLSPRFELTMIHRKLNEIEEEYNKRKSLKPKSKDGPAVASAKPPTIPRTPTTRTPDINTRAEPAPRSVASEKSPGEVLVSNTPPIRKQPTSNAAAPKAGPSEKASKGQPDTNESSPETQNVLDFSYAAELQERVNGMKVYAGTKVTPESSTAYRFANESTASITKIVEWAKEHGMNPQTSPGGKAVLVTIIGHDQGIGFRGPRGNSEKILERKPEKKESDTKGPDVLEFSYAEELQERMNGIEKYKGTEVIQAGKTSYFLKNTSPDTVNQIEYWAKQHGMRPMKSVSGDGVYVEITGHEQGYGFYGPDGKGGKSDKPSVLADKALDTPTVPVSIGRPSAAAAPAPAPKAAPSAAPATPTAKPAESGDLESENATLRKQIADLIARIKALEGAAKNPSKTPDKPVVPENRKVANEAIGKLEAENNALGAEWAKILGGAPASLNEVNPVTKKDGITRIREIAEKKEANNKEIARLRTQTDAREQNENLPDNVDQLIARRGEIVKKIQGMSTAEMVKYATVNEIEALNTQIQAIDAKLATMRATLVAEINGLSGKVDNASVARITVVNAEIKKIDAVLLSSMTRAPADPTAKIKGPVFSLDGIQSSPDKKGEVLVKFENGFEMNNTLQVLNIARVKEALGGADIKADPERTVLILKNPGGAGLTERQRTILSLASVMAHLSSDQFEKAKELTATRSWKEFALDAGSWIEENASPVTTMTKVARWFGYAANVDVNKVARDSLGFSAEAYMKAALKAVKESR